jgi:putative ABC transport system ATP-binding protein
MTNTILYSLKDLNKTYSNNSKKVQALKNVNLEIAQGELISIQGPTGGGKSTLLQMLGGLDQPTSGSISLADDNLEKLNESKLTEIRAKKIGFVFQNYNLIPTLTALENVQSALVPQGVGKTERERRALAALNSVSLSDRAGHLPAELSGGQQQRVAIARALVKNPMVILADEPTGNLDEETRDQIIDLLFNLNKNEGITVILVTHDSSVAKRASKSLHIANGSVTAKSH